MFPHPMSRSEFQPDDASPDPTETLEQHLFAGFPPDLALDLVLNELVVRAAEATHATAAALALVRGDEMVCRAATGNLAPDLGIPLNPRDGLSGACLQTHQPQLSVDTEFDPRVDPTVSRRLGIRSILIVPVFDSPDKNAQFAGVLEVFSTSPAAFSDVDQKRLESYAEECARIRRAALEVGERPRVAPPGASIATSAFLPELLPPAAEVHESFAPDLPAESTAPARRGPYEGWTVVLGGLAIVTIVAFSFLIGARVGWLRRAGSQRQIAQSQVEESLAATPADDRANPVSAEKASSKNLPTKTPARPTPTPAADELVVYEKGKVIFRMKPAPKSGSDAVVEASSTTRIVTAKTPTTTAAATKTGTAKAAARSVWLSQAQAETHLLSRVEPQYPAEALAAHRAGDVVLEVQVSEDGSVSNVRTLAGDPLLAAAASEAVRNWRYRPYRQNDQPAQFQTDVTLSFTLPN